MEGKVRQLESSKGGASKSCKTCTRGGHEGRCLGLNMTCFACKQEGHMKGSKACRHPKPATKPNKHKGKGGDKARQVAEGSTEDTDSEEVDRVMIDEPVRAVKHENSRKARVDITLTVVDHKVPGRPGQVQLLIDSGVYKTLLSEKDWKLVAKKDSGTGKMRLKINRTKFQPFGTNLYLPILGCTKCRIKSMSVQEVFTIVYVVKDATESLLGLKDAEASALYRSIRRGGSLKGTW